MATRTTQEVEEEKKEEVTEKIELEGPMIVTKIGEVEKTREITEHNNNMSNFIDDQWYQFLDNELINNLDNND